MLANFNRIVRNDDNDELDPLEDEIEIYCEDDEEIEPLRLNSDNNKAIAGYCSF